MHRAEHCLQRVGQDAGLVPAAGGLLAAAKPQVRTEPARAEAARYGLPALAC